MPLIADGCRSIDAAARLRAIDAKKTWPHARGPKSCLSALWIYFSEFDQPHCIVPKLKSTEGAYWHAILHRMEPDPGNAGYWFRQLGAHPVFRQVALAAYRTVTKIPEAEFRCNPAKWDPYAFVGFCERARRQPGSPSETAAQEIQLAEWQALFDYCMMPRR